MQTSDEKISQAANGPISALGFIRSEFPGASVSEFKALTEIDRIQLASAIAILRGLTAAQLAFIPVSY
jgi:hypothetical protein